MADKYVYDFEEGNKDMKYLLGGKGANLAEMTRMGLPVPHGFTVTCEACNAYRAAGRRFPAGMLDEVAEHLRRLEELELLISRWERQGSRRRRIYRITSHGKRELELQRLLARSMTRQA